MLASFFATQIKKGSPKVIKLASLQVTVLPLIFILSKSKESKYVSKHEEVLDKMIIE